MKIRELNPSSENEIHLVAQRMRQTLIEVLGKERGVAMYTLDWLIARVRWHLDPNSTNGRVFLAENKSGEIVGHAIARIDHGTSFGYFSTIFVEPSSRRNGLATQLMKHVEAWFLKLSMPKIIYNTSSEHKALISLFNSHGYKVTLIEDEMVQLIKLI